MLESNFIEAGLSATSKATEVSENAALYPYAAFAAVRCGETTEALLTLERGKTRLLTEALHLYARRPPHVPDKIWSTFEQARTTVRVKQTEKTLTIGEGRDPVRTYETHVQDARAALDTLDVAIEHVRAYAPHFLEAIDLPTIKAQLLNKHTVLIAFCITEQGSMGFVVSQHDQEIVQVVEVPTFTQTDLRRLAIEFDADGEPTGGWLRAYHHYQIGQTPTAFAVWQETMIQTLDTLGQRLLDPILATLPTDIEHLIFLPSAQLFLFPLHAVPLAGNHAEQVGDRCRVSYAPSIEVLANTRARVTQDASPDLYAVINPEADPDLLFISREGATIAALFTHSILDEGRTGTKQQVMTRIRGQTYLHFACHGSYDWDDPTASGLDLADARLTLAELQQGNVDLYTTRLVTLSACETGMADIRPNSAEEYISVPAGFMLAGVPCVISSLWAVPDLSTALLMERFYYNHLKSGMGFAAALREAQRWVRTMEIRSVAEYAEQCYDQSGGKNAALWRQYRHYRSLAEENPDWCPFAHPYYWAAFTVNGW